MKKFGSGYQVNQDRYYMLKAVLMALFILSSSFLFFSEPELAINTATISDKATLDTNPLLDCLRELFKWLSSLY